MTYVITEPCIGTKDQSCVEVCPVDCIYDGGDQFLINPEECIDCGASRSARWKPSTPKMRSQRRCSPT
jgi:NAD-dependent dihydropyrimidine dehydrogenase PreA subunit